MLGFARTTLIGGIVFLIPVVVFVVLLGKALQLLHNVAAPLSARLGADALLGILAADILAAILLVAVCFIAGLVARTSTARRWVRSLEENVLERVPAYALLKARTDSALRPEDMLYMKPVIVRFDDAWQLAFEVDQADGDMRVVFLPGAPDVWSGSFCAVTAARVTPLSLSVKEAADMARRLGIRSGRAFLPPD